MIIINRTDRGEPFGKALACPRAAASAKAGNRGNKCPLFRGLHFTSHGISILSVIGFSNLPPSALRRGPSDCLRNACFLSWPSSRPSFLSRSWWVVSSLPFSCLRFCSWFSLLQRLSLLPPLSKIKFLPAAAPLPAWGTPLPACASLQRSINFIEAFLKCQEPVSFACTICLDI